MNTHKDTQMLTLSPPEIVFHIVSFLYTFDKLSCRLTCKSLRDVVDLDVFDPVFNIIHFRRLFSQFTPTFTSVYPNRQIQYGGLGSFKMYYGRHYLYLSFSPESWLTVECTSPENYNTFSMSVFRSDKSILAHFDSDFRMPHRRALVFQYINGVPTFSEQPTGTDDMMEFLQLVQKNTTDNMRDKIWLLCFDTPHNGYSAVFLHNSIRIDEYDLNGKCIESADFLVDVSDVKTSAVIGFDVRGHISDSIPYCFLTKRHNGFFAYWANLRMMMLFDSHSFKLFPIHNPFFKTSKLYIAISTSTKFQILSFNRETSNFFVHFTDDANASKMFQHHLKDNSHLMYDAISVYSYALKKLIKIDEIGAPIEVDIQFTNLDKKVLK